MTGQPPPQPLAPGWGQDLYTGAAGIALAHIEHAHRATVSWRSAHDWISTMVRGPITAHPDASGLDNGAPAVAFTLHSADQSCYTHPLALLDTHITATTCCPALKMPMKAALRMPMWWDGNALPVVFRQGVGWCGVAVGGQGAGVSRRLR